METARTWIRTMVRWAPTMALLAVTALMLGAGGDRQVQARPNNDTFCGKYQTAEVTFRNDSRETTYDVIWDGAYVGVVRPGQSQRGTASAGRHHLEFKLPNSDRSACFVDDALLAVCSSVTFSCDHPE